MCDGNLNQGTWLLSEGGDTMFKMMADQAIWLMASKCRYSADRVKTSVMSRFGFSFPAPGSYSGLSSVLGSGNFFLYIDSNKKAIAAMPKPIQPISRGTIWNQPSTIKTNPTHLASINILFEFNLIILLLAL